MTPTLHRPRAPQPKRPKPDRSFHRLEQYRPVTIHPGNWGQLLTDWHPVGGILDRDRG